MRLIGVAGRSGSGKTVAAALLAAELIDNGDTVKLDAFAVSIKRRIRDQERREYIDKTLDRAFMQRYGEAMRYGNPHWFINDLFVRNTMDAGMRDHFSDRREPADFLIVGDVRYPNEAEFIRKRGVLVFVDGSRTPLAGAEAAHESESHMDALLAMADAVILPNLSFEQVRRFLRALVRTRSHVRDAAPPSRDDDRPA